MISPENLINQLQKENEQITKELEQAQKDIKDFEKLAIEWKKGYKDLENKYKVEIINLKQIIEELQNDLNILEEQQLYNSRS